MIATWMIYCTLTALWLGGAALVVEQALGRSRAPLRPVWAAALALSLVLPAVAFARSRMTPSPAARLRTTERPAVDAGHPSSNVRKTEGSPTRSGAPVQAPSPLASWSARLARADTTLGAAWLASSLLVALYLTGGMLGLAAARRRWRAGRVLGVPVLVSDDAGPAVVGVAEPVIVLPTWALAMEESQLALILRHEEEHRQAGDGQLVWAAQLALAVMPWNVALWWQMARLRAAVELDCDARVLRGVDVRTYGSLLLDVLRPRTRGSIRLLGAIPFAEHARLLERRLVVMARPIRRATRWPTVTVISTGVVAIVAACAAPRPPMLATVSAGPPAGRLASVTPVVVTSAPANRAEAVANAPKVIAVLRSAAAGIIDGTAASDSASSVAMQQVPMRQLPLDTGGASIRELARSAAPGCDVHAPPTGDYPVLTIVVPDAHLSRQQISVAVWAAPAGSPLTVAYSTSLAAGESMRCTAPSSAANIRVYGRELFTDEPVLTVHSDAWLIIQVVDSSGRTPTPMTVADGRMVMEWMRLSDPPKSAIGRTMPGFRIEPGTATRTYSWP